MGTDGTQTQKDSIPTQGQDSSKVAPPSAEQVTAFYKGIEDYANQKHSKLDKGIADRDKYLRLAQYEIGQHQEKNAKLQGDLDALIAKGEGGADIVKLRKQIQDEQIVLRKERDMFSLEKAQIEEDAKQLHSTKLSDLIEDLCTAKEENPEQRAKLIANVKSFNPNTAEDVERIVGMLNVPPVVKTPEASTLGGGGGSLSDNDLIKKVGDLSYTPSSAELKRVEQILIKRKQGG